MSNYINDVLDEKIYFNSKSSSKEDDSYVESNNVLLLRLNWNIDLAIKLLTKMKETIIENKIILDYKDINNNLEALIKQISE